MTAPAGRTARGQYRYQLLVLLRRCVEAVPRFNGKDTVEIFYRELGVNLLRSSTLTTVFAHRASRRGTVRLSGEQEEDTSPTPPHTKFY